MPAPPPMQFTPLNFGNQSSNGGIGKQLAALANAGASAYPGIQTALSGNAAPGSTADPSDTTVGMPGSQFAGPVAPNAGAGAGPAGAGMPGNPLAGPVDPNAGAPGQQPPQPMVPNQPQGGAMIGAPPQAGQPPAGAGPGAGGPGAGALAGLMTNMNPMQRMAVLQSLLKGGAGGAAAGLPGAAAIGGAGMMPSGLPAWASTGGQGGFGGT